LGIGTLRLSPLQILELNKFALISAKFLGGFQFHANFACRALAFRVDRRNDQSRFAVFHGGSIIRRQCFMSFVGIHFAQYLSARPPRESHAGFGFGTLASPAKSIENSLQKPRAIF
jgi:hypothetical protein